MFLNFSAGDKGYCRLPKEFLPKSLSDRWRKILEVSPGYPIKSPVDLVNWSIQSIDLPEFSYTPITQLNYEGVNKKKITSLPIEELTNKQVTITFATLDGWVNYWILQEAYKEFYKNGEEQYLPDGIQIGLNTVNGLQIGTVQLYNVLFTQLGSISINFTNNSIDTNSFTATFEYNQIDFKPTYI